MKESPHVWLLGNGGFYNRGCEAIHRTTIELLTEELGPCHFTVWSPDYANDSTQGNQPNVAWKPYQVVNGWLWGAHSPLRLKFPLVEGLPSKSLRNMSARFFGLPDCVLSLGGDNFSLDYGLNRMFVAHCEYFHQYNIPTVIWSASIGPFTKEPTFEKEMAEFLGRVSLITVRESATLDYLGSLGVGKNMVRVSDVAFALEPEEYKGPEVDFLCTNDVVGLNVSELMVKWYGRGDRDAFLCEIAEFVGRLVHDGYKVALVPHVTKEDGPLATNDAAFLRMVYDRISNRSERVAVMPANISAKQMKWVISQCQFFFGARTHATIAAVSSSVPTVAIAYSAKARGIWQDIFGHTDYLLETDELSSETLMQKMHLLVDDEKEIRKTLAGKHQEMLDGARKNAVVLADLLRHKLC